MIKELTQQLDGRLRSVSLTYRHVQIIDEDDRLLAYWWPKDALTTLVQLRHDDVLRLVGGRLCREVENVWPVDVLVESVQQEVDHIGALSSSGRTNEQQRLLMCDYHLHQIRIAYRPDGWHDDLIVASVLWYRRHVS